MKPNIAFIRQAIQELGDRFTASPTRFFNESDLQSELFTLLLEKYGMEEEMTDTGAWGTEKTRSLKRVTTRPLHSELLLENRRIDLAVLDLRQVTFRVNSKGRFGYIQLQRGNNNHVFIEIKSSRTNRSYISSRKGWVGQLASDIDKLNRLSHYSHVCFLACFDFNLYLDDAAVAHLRESGRENVELLYFKDAAAGNYYVNEDGSLT
jgi:hypothetical protein